ncbi:hypothetical protein BN2364_1134 [Alloalcanivorax xenomutans]|nr:hypothetical protein BN2364_1134 [Alloalcanivorax xenomutans]
MGAHWVSLVRLAMQVSDFMIQGHFWPLAAFRADGLIDDDAG